MLSIRGTSFGKRCPVTVQFEFNFDFWPHNRPLFAPDEHFHLIQTIYDFLFVNLQNLCVWPVHELVTLTFDFLINKKDALQYYLHVMCATLSLSDF